MVDGQIANLVASEERFRILVESVRDYGIFMLSPDGRVETWNKGAERLKGYTAQEIIGQHFSKFYPQSDVEAGKCDVELEVAARDGRFEDEGWRIRKDGTRFWANVVITALRKPDGGILGFAKVTRDLTERRRAEEQARRYRLLVESVKDYAIFILSPEGNVETWNPGAQRLKGYTSKEIIGKHFSIFYPQADVLAGKCDHELVVARQEGRFEDEGWRLTKEGTRFWANVTITALRDETGQLVGFAKVTRDLTERKNAEEKLRTLAAEKATLAEKARLQDFHERFVAILGHDLRNPLASIDMGTSILKKQGPTPDALRILERMSTSAKRMRTMIEQILDLTRTRYGGFEISPQSIDLATVLGTVVEELRVAYPQRRIVLNAPPLNGSWDKDRMEQVFSNLIGNALQHGTLDQPVTVRAWSEVAGVIVEVHNFGEPIPDMLRDKLFDPYRRGDRDSRSAATAGLGLGLYISKEIAVAHGGDINVASSDASGTTFRVTLPLVSAARRDALGRAS
jgi:PAS domain S-box-containing protein